MKRLESNDWRFKTDELLAHYTVLIQRQLYDLLISKGYKISYQKFNDYLRKNTMITRRKLFDSSNALMVMFKGKSLSRFKCLELILMNTYLIEKDLRTGFVYDGDFYRGVRALVKKFIESNKVPEEQKEAMKTQRDLYQAFINVRNAVLKDIKLNHKKMKLYSILFIQEESILELHQIIFYISLLLTNMTILLYQRLYKQLWIYKSSMKQK